MTAKFSRSTGRILIVLLAMVVVLSALAGCAQPASTPADSADPSPPAAARQDLSQFDVLQAAAEKYLESDVTKGDPNIKAEDLYYILNDGDPANDPFIVSVRAPADYEKGHIPGAINIPWRDIAKPENLAKLPTDKLIVVYCYTGQTGSQATAILNMLGYNAKNLKFGMTSWTKDDTVASNRFDPEKTPKDYKVETTVKTPTGSYEFPVVSVTSSVNAFEIIRAAAEAYLASDRAKNANIKAEDLFYVLNDGDASNDPLIVSVRAAADYQVGHVPGAINIAWREIARKENLAKLPTDKTIVVYCYTGHTGSQTTAVLNVLGYQARNMSQGMSAWSKNMDVVKSRFDQARDGKDYKFVVGASPN